MEGGKGRKGDGMVIGCLLQHGTDKQLPSHESCSAHSQLARATTAWLQSTDEKGGADRPSHSTTRQCSALKNGIRPRE